METKIFIPFCRYYKGEKVNPNKGGNDALFWDYEKQWCEWNTTDDGKEILMRMLDEYGNMGMLMFESDDKVPVSLKALLFNRCGKGGLSMVDCIKEFPEYYKAYKKGATK